MNDFVKERHEAFAEALHHENVEPFRKYCEKYGMPRVWNKKVEMLTVMKAIQHCTDFSEEDKLLAMQWCLDRGYNPLVDWGCEEDD